MPVIYLQDTNTSTHFISYFFNPDIDQIGHKIMQIKVYQIQQNFKHTGGKPDYGQKKTIYIVDL